MADLPIIFSTPMIVALRDGRKTQTRRIIKPQPPADSRYSGIHYASYEPASWFFNSPHGSHKARATYAVGDRLWVRENFAILPRPCYDLPKTIAPDKDMAAYYRADFDRSGRPPWKPSIHMPRWASRLTLIVTDVFVQRLQDIGEEDAKAEGAPWYVGGHGVISDDEYAADPGYQPSKRDGFEWLWNETHGWNPNAWALNPWIVAITFAVHHANIDALSAAASICEAAE